MRSSSHGMIASASRGIVLRACMSGRTGKSSGRRERPDCSAASRIMRCQRCILAGPVCSRPAMERRHRVGAKTATPDSVPFSRIHSKRADLSSPWQRMIRTGDSLLPTCRSSNCTATRERPLSCRAARTSLPLLSSNTRRSPSARRRTSRTWCASSWGRETVAPVSFNSSGETKKRCTRSHLLITNVTQSSIIVRSTSPRPAASKGCSAS